MKKFVFALTTAFVGLFQIAFSQKVDSILYKISNEFAAEKIYMHFDKQVYKASETIWFKVYIMDGSLPSNQSKNFYADWYNDKGELLKHDAYPIFQSTAKGQFQIPEKYSGNTIHVKAYTKWMLNEDTAFFFNKYLNVIQTGFIQTNFTDIKSTVQFFPEGGDIINGIGTFIAFKATNQYGKPINISGVVKNNIGELIDSVKSDYDGMGTFYIAEPSLQQQYTFYYKDEYSGIEHSKLLPNVKDIGVGMQVQNVGKFVNIVITRTNDASEDKKFLKLYGLSNNEVVYRANIKLLNKTKQTVQIETDSFPSGILQFTLFSGNDVPLSERIVFVKNENYSFLPSINIVSKNLGKRGKNSVQISVNDTLLNNMSVAITDVDAVTDTNTNIFSQLLLSGDIKGSINNPAYYFNNNDETTQQRLDLVMLTNGWRRYNWQEITKGKMPVQKVFRDSTYLEILGNCFGVSKNDLIQKPDIFLFLQSKDSSKKQYILPIRKDGTFGKSNIFFYDTLQLYYTFLGNNKLNRSAEVTFKNGLFNAPSKFNLDTTYSKYLLLDTSFFAKQKRLDDEYKRLVNTKGSGVLKEVTVRTRTKNPKSMLDDKYTSGLFNGGDAYQFDLINDNTAASGISIFTYLRGMVPGLQIIENDGETEVKWRQSTTSFFIDEMSSDAVTAGNLSMNDIAYIKVFRPPFFGGSGGSPGGAIAIYTRKGNDVKSTPGKGIPFKFLEGYTQHKEFYSPNYEVQNDVTIPDTRTTLYWNPYILTDATNKKAIISFYNNDFTKKFKIILCGINSEGKLAYVEKIIE